MRVAGLFGGTILAVLLASNQGWTADSAEIGRFVNARIEIGEMMTNYFQGGERFGEGERPSPERMQEMRTDINSKVSAVLSKYGLTIEEYRGRSKEIFGDEAAVKSYLDQHPDLKSRYEALPLDRMGSGGGRRY
ncbi:hypothetical protein YTPLAS18_19440 [Nitrospira sp.]|nr:hypothetical protein YTPLAS18_19440 [Nitrospira sp.]